MCGIAGYVSNRPFNGLKMISTLEHRGPDAMGEFYDTVADKTIYLGHTRLSILDLSPAGQQPMTSARHDVTIVYNGEVYNFRELKARFLQGYTFSSTTDTEVLLNLYLELGLNFVNELNGDFAIVIYDARYGRLYLFRDRMGVKPLYMYQGQGTFAFASEIKAIQALGVSLSLSHDSLQKYVVFKYVPEQGTLYREVTRLEPGCWLEFDVRTSKKQVHTYWDIAPATEPKRASYADLKAELRDVLADAVRIRLMSDVPIGTFLSGGLDSSIIAHFVKDHPDITHYCAQKSTQDLQKEGTTSDFYHASKLAKAWNLGITSIYLDPNALTTDLIDRTIYYGDDLIADGSQIPSYLIARAASTSSRVMLSGMGADELFLGYASHLLTLMAECADHAPPRASYTFASICSRLSQGKGSFKAYRRWLHKFGKYYNRPYIRTIAYSVVGDLQNSLKVCRQDTHGIVDLLTQFFSVSDDPFECLFHFERKNFLVKNLHYFDRMCMANGIEGRVPFLDHRVVEFAASLKRSHKLSNTGISKKILKDAMADVLPAHIVKRRKAGFGMPLRSIFSQSSNVDALIDLDFLYGFSFFDIDHIRTLIASHIAGEEDNSSIIYALISFQSWYRQQEAGDYIYATTNTDLKRR